MQNVSHRAREQLRQLRYRSQQLLASACALIAGAKQQSNNNEAGEQRATALTHEGQRNAS